MSERPTTPDRVTPLAFKEAGGTEDWPVVGDGAHAYFRTNSLAVAASFVAAIAALDGIDAHQPDIDLRPDGVTVRLLTQEQWFGMSQRDIVLARRISAIAESMALPPDPSRVQSVHPIVIGARDIAMVMPFWEALFDYVRRPDSPDEDLIDPRGRGPGIWFEQIQDAGQGRNRMHVGVWVAHEQAEARVAAAVAAGGTIIFDRAAPSWWTLADPEGNEADVATTQNRG